MYDERDILLNQLRQYLHNIQFREDRQKWDDKAINLLNEYFEDGGLHIESNFFETPDYHK